MTGKLRKLLSAATLLCVGLVATMAVAGDKSLSSAGAANDPRSGAALNLLHAKKVKRTWDAQIYRHASGRLIGKLPVNNPAADLTAQDTQSETTLVDLGGGNMVAAFNDSGSFVGGAPHFTGYAFSSNSGNTWTDGGALPASAGGDAGDPVLAFNPVTGTVFLATLEFNSLANIQVFRSADMGHTFAAPVNATPGVGGQQDKEWIAVDNFAGSGAGNVYLCWTRFNPNGDIMFTRSTDGGATFGPAGGVLLSTGGQGCFAVVSPNHQVNVFYYRGTGGGGQGGDNKLFLRRSTDRGVSFGPEVQVADLNTTTVNGNLTLNGGLRSNSFPHAAVNPLAAKPFLYVVYNDDPNIADTTDNGAIFMVRSTDGGTTWSAPQIIDNSAGDQFFPTIGFPTAGTRPMVGYYSRSQDPSNLAFHRRARLGKLNAAGAVAFDPSFQLGPNTPIVIGQDPVINSTYMGDYDQISGGAGTLSSTWADNRLGNTFHANQPDIRFTRIAVPPPAADLAVSVAAPASKVIGAAFNANVTVSSTGGSNDVFANIAFEPGLQLISATVVGGTCHTGGGFTGCSLGNILTGASKVVKLKLRGILVAGIRTVSAQATTSSKDTAQANNSASGNVSITAGGTVTRRFSTGDIAVPINDLSTVDVSLPVAPAGTAVQIIPRIRLDHTFDADLDIFLVSPSGQIVELSTDNGLAGDNYGSGTNNCAGVPTRFNDLAATSIAAGAPPFTGQFRPERQITEILGGPSNGTWKLRVADDFSGDIGTIGCFELDITRLP